MSKTDVILVCDCSGSMESSFYGAPMQVQKRLVAEVVAELAKDPEISIQLVSFGRNVRVGKKLIANTPAAADIAKSLSGYDYMLDNGGTSLRDAIGTALKLMDVDTPTLIQVYTDGGENSSRTYGPLEVSKLLAAREGTGNLTLTLAGPAGAGVSIGELGLKPGNFRPWDGSAKELEVVKAETVGSTQSYMAERKKGIRSTTRFYADPSELTATGIKGSTKQVTPKTVSVCNARMAGRSIADYFGGAFIPGTHYYELIKPEYIQEDKDFVVYVVDKNEYRIGSRSMRQLLKLPETGKIRVHPPKPDASGVTSFKIFVQSTSQNRKVVEGQTMLTIE